MEQPAVRAAVKHTTSTVGKGRAKAKKRTDEERGRSQCCSIPSLFLFHDRLAPALDRVLFRTIDFDSRSSHDVIFVAERQIVVRTSHGWVALRLARQRISGPSIGSPDRRSFVDTHPLRPRDLPVVPVTGGVFEDIAAAFVEVVQGESMLVGIVST